jgi:octaprenyl-diphosphate synthase
LIQAVERRLEQYVSSLEQPLITELYRKLPHGKRLRAKLILYIAGGTHEAIKLASIVELIHAASLLHDDVIDDAMLRRNKPSINAVYGNKISIMLGDILYSKGFYELTMMESKIAQIISNAVTQLSIGELYDVEMAKEFNCDKNKYIDMIYGKTASLIEASAWSAALLCGKSAQNYKQYGRNLGLAFQMIDDILDITSSSEVLGKPSLHDFSEGKTTIPYIYLYDALDNEKKAILKSFHKKILSKDEEDWILDEMKQNDILSKCYSDAKSLIDEAISLMSYENEPKLVAIAKEMIDRNF